MYFFCGANSFETKPQKLEHEIKMCATWHHITLFYGTLRCIEFYQTYPNFITVKSEVALALTRLNHSQNDTMPVGTHASPSIVYWPSQVCVSFGTWWLVLWCSLVFFGVLWCSLVFFVLESQHAAWSPAQAAKYGEMPYCYASMDRPLEYLQIWVNCRLVTTSHN